jgi:hypothetical protein
VKGKFPIRPIHLSRTVQQSEAATVPCIWPDELAAEKGVVLPKGGTLFLHEFFETLYASLALILIYCGHKSRIPKLTDNIA